MCNGDKVLGKVCFLKENECYYGLLYVEVVNGEDLEMLKDCVYFLVLMFIYLNE